MTLRRITAKSLKKRRVKLQAKVIEIYEASADEIKAVVKEKKEGTLKKVSTGLRSSLKNSLKSSKKKKEEEATPSTEAAAPVEETSSKEKEIVVEEEKKEEVVWWWRR
ncbi:unnamed protein product [Lactuca virosa]|uniref:Uncharacterized protein n=1 Tax=Lactuca virosa TaxID=75947 RepID=A0AAU9MXV6_9ASTR|nr:unnamed protein product [Lactuca virosa]